MNTTLAVTARPLARALVATALLSASLAASALNAFTIDPFAAGLGTAGNAFTADNLIVTDYATVMRTGPNTFTETGFLSIGIAQLDSAFVLPPGLNTNYSLYIAFNGVGTTAGGDPTLVDTKGVFDSMSYTIYGYNGVATFGFNSSHMPTTTATNPVALASGVLKSGSVTTTPTNPVSGSFTPSANALFRVDSFNAAVLSFPVPFFNEAITSFTNTSNQVQVFADGFMIKGGGGSINFATAVPEPETYAMLLAGLGVVGFVAGRRRRLLGFRG